VTVADFAQNPDIFSMFLLPLSTQAFEELQQVQQIMRAWLSIQLFMIPVFLSGAVISLLLPNITTFYLKGCHKIGR
jgi:O-antigen/teichoic acid export membrane protein